jgi:hypothetical protein
VSAQLKARVLAAAAAEPSPTRAAVNRRNILISMLAVASGVGAFVIFARLTSEGQLVSMLGRARSWLLCGIVLIPLGLFAWKVSCSLAFGSDDDRLASRTLAVYLCSLRKALCRKGFQRSVRSRAALLRRDDAAALKTSAQVTSATRGRRQVANRDHCSMTCAPLKPEASRCRPTRVLYPRRTVCRGVAQSRI